MSTMALAFMLGSSRLCLLLLVLKVLIEVELCAAAAVPHPDAPVHTLIRPFLPKTFEQPV